MHNSLERRESTLWVIHQKLLNQIYCVRGGAGTEYFLQWVRLNLGKLKLAIVRVHTVNLFSRGCPKDLDYLD